MTTSVPGRTSGASRLSDPEVIRVVVLGYLVAIATSAVYAVGRGQLLDEPGVRSEAHLVAVWTALLGALPTVVLGFPAALVLAALLRRVGREWVHVVTFGVVGLTLAGATATVLAVATSFVDLAPQDGVFARAATAAVFAVTVGAPWGIGAAAGRLAVARSARRRWRAEATDVVL